jgi:hypothetical protein
MTDTAIDLNVFTPFPKIPRLESTMVVTEKIDGTNAAVVVTPDGDVYAQSRSRVITPADDNYGFARWVEAHAPDLAEGLGVGCHFGEWWGKGIQRGYGLEHRRFSLFNVGRWADERPACCHVVPILYFGPFDSDQLYRVREDLFYGGSVAAPGFDRPEGVMVWHERARQYFKSPFEAAPKGAKS